MEKIKNGIKGLDMFGYKFTIYFKGREASYPTVMGGLLSMAVNVIILW